MTNRTIGISPQVYARIVAVLYLIVIAAGIPLAFFGISTFLNGYLVFNSTFLPRILGVLSMLGGLGWLTFVYPPLGNQLSLYVLLLALVGSLSQIGWLLARGVNVEQWKKRALESA